MNVARKQQEEGGCFPPLLCPDGSVAAVDAVIRFRARNKAKNWLHCMLVQPLGFRA